ncbi:hypothetical protein QYM36_007232, partial [Artemia franciscana]
TNHGHETFFVRFHGIALSYALFCPCLRSRAHFALILFLQTHTAANLAAGDILAFPKCYEAQPVCYEAQHVYYENTHNML